MTPRALLSLYLGIAIVAIAGSGCAYYNTLYNARAKYREALDLKAQADPERLKISTQEEQLYTAAFERASRVVQEYPDSRWIDDALLLMGRVSFEQSDYSKADRTLDNLLVNFPDSNLREEALVMQARTLIATKEYAAAAAKLQQAAEYDEKELRDEIVYFHGLAQYEQGNRDEARKAFEEVLAKHKDSEWFADAGMLAGEIARDDGNLAASVECFERVRAHAEHPEDRFRGGTQKGEALMKLSEFDRARTTFADVAKRSLDEEKRSEALLMMGKAIEASGDVEKSRAVYLELIEKYPRQEVAARAQFTIAAHYDELGDLERAVAEYDLVKEQGTGHPASQEAAARQVEIQRVLDLRAELASDNVEEVERKRFLLAEQLLEEIGDAEGAAAEYGALAVDAFGTEWGARALLASAWVFEHRLDRPDTANALLFRLANGYSSTEADEVARRRLGYPVWRVEQLDPGPVEFIRPEGSEEGPEEIFVQRVEPRNVPLPEGETNVEVWIRLGLNPDGTVRSTKIVRSAGEAFDDAVVEAAQASTFVGPNAGGPEFTVQKYAFPPVLAASTEPAPAASTNGRSATPLGVGDEPPDALAPPSSMPFEPGKYDSTTNPESLFSTPATDSSATSASSDSSDSSAAADSSIPGFRGNGTQTPD